MTTSASLKRIARIAAAPLHRRLSQGNVGGLWFTIGFTLFIPVLALIIGLWHPLALFVGALLLLAMGGILVLGWWAVFVISVAEQAALPTSSLVPGHARHLGFALWGVAGIITLLYGMAFGGLLHRFVVPAVLTFVVLTLVAAFLHGRWLGIIAAALLVGGRLPHAGAWVKDAFTAATPASRADVTMVVAGLLFICLWTFASIAPSGRRRPAVPREAVAVAKVDARPVAAAEGADVVDQATAPAAPADIGRGPATPAWWRSGRLPPEQGDPLARALSVLPLGADWAFQLRRRAGRWLFPLVMAGVVSTFSSLAAYAHVALIVISFMAMGFITDDAMAPWHTLAATRREQQFIALLPGLPRAENLGRSLALRFSAAWLAGVATATAGLALVAALLARADPHDWRDTLATVTLVPLSSLPLVALQWKDWARASPPGGMAGLAALVVPFASWGVVVGACALHWTTLPVVTLACTGAALLWCAWRWLRMASAPSPLPFGRLA
jgi:hypothetical protein